MSHSHHHHLCRVFFFVFWYTSVNIHLFPSLFGPVHRQKVMRSYKNLKLTASLSAPHITLTLHIWISLILHIEVIYCIVDIVAEFSLAETILKTIICNIIYIYIWYYIISILLYYYVYFFYVWSIHFLPTQPPWPKRRRTARSKALQCPPVAPLEPSCPAPSKRCSGWPVARGRVMEAWNDWIVGENVPYIILHYFILYYITLCYIISCYIILYDIILYYIILDVIIFSYLVLY